MYFELENLFINSFASFFAAIARKESRGAHFRSDYPSKDDAEWLAHSLVMVDGMEFEGIKLVKKGIVE